VAFWLGFIGIYFLLYGNQRVQDSPKVSFFIGWFAAALVAMLAALVVQAEVLNLRNALGMMIVAITGYGVFWYGISRPIKKF
jgi:drug/metabolite transporter (DMT)-like permease